jgi:hypothetical protein
MLRRRSLRGGRDFLRRSVACEIMEFSLQEQFSRRHAVLRKRPGLVGENHRSAAQGLDCRKVLFFRATRCAAMASESVTVGSNPSGTLATMIPIANMRFCQRKAKRLSDEEEDNA